MVCVDPNSSHTGTLFIDSHALVSQGTFSAAHQVHLALQGCSTEVGYSSKEGTPVKVEGSM